MACHGMSRHAMSACELRKRSIQRLSEDMAQTQLFLEVSLEKTSSASQAEERLTSRLDEGLRNLQFDSQLHPPNAFAAFEHLSRLVCGGDMW